MWLLFISIILLEITLNLTRLKTTECIKKHPYILFSLILHHIANCFLLYGWILNNITVLSIHVLVCVSTIIYWITNSNLCDITVYVNRICGWDNKEPFHDLIYFFGFKKIPRWNSLWHYILVSLIAFISIYKIRIRR